MKKFFLLIALFILQGCASNFLVNQSIGALRYEAITQLPTKEIIGERAYVGGQIVTVDPNKRQIELVKRYINDSGYPEEGTNSFNQRIFVTIPDTVSINFYDLYIGDRMAVLGTIIDFQHSEIAGNDMGILQINANDYRTWTSRVSSWDDDPFPWNPYRRHWRYRPWYY